jgi:hypothetical protein
MERAEHGPWMQGQQHFLAEEGKKEAYQPCLPWFGEFLGVSRSASDRAHLCSASLAMQLVPSG